jgi:predicted O-linked N-acetylglucosamine transferase (SPINDLY family)
MKVCTAATKKIKLGIASGFLTPQSSVAADFMGVLQRLDRNVFDVTYIHFCANSGNVTDQFVYHHEEDKVLLLSKTLADQENGAWVTRYHKHVETLDLDILLYLDLTMSPHATRVAMARLARVQATTHGHPVTSGIPSVDYYISWGAAELETAQSHYSEKLVLLDATGPHQYYEMRHNNNDRSVIDGGNYNAAPLTPSQKMAIGTHACKSLTNSCQKWTTLFAVCYKMINKAVSFFIGQTP